jgi:hypothetical protein
MGFSLLGGIKSPQLDPGGRRLFFTVAEHEDN